MRKASLALRRVEILLIGTLACDACTNAGRSSKVPCKMDAEYGRNVFEIDFADVIRLQTSGTRVVEVSGGDRHIGSVLIAANEPDVVPNCSG